MSSDTSNDRSTAHAESFFFTARFGLALLGLAVCFNMYAQRIAMSVAIVCMVNDTAVAALWQQEQSAALAVNGDSLVTAAAASSLAVTDTTGLQQLTTRHPCSSKDVESSSRSNESVSRGGSFSWSKEVQGHILGSFFYGYLLSQIPSGLLAERFGAKWVLVSFLGLSTVATLLTPAAARLGHQVLIFVRVLMGVGAGALFPAMHAMWGKWAPPMERSKLAGISYAGSMMGSVVAMPISGLLCRYGFDDGWGSVFYTIGGSSLVVLILWAALTTSTPATNKLISITERQYITDSLAGEVSNKKPSWRDMPWKEIATSRPVWAVIVANFCMDWSGYTLMTNIPTFYKEVLKFDIESNGLYSALPFLGLWISMTCIPVLADYLRAKEILSTTATRKIFTSIGLFAGAVFLIGLSFLDCTMTGLAVALMTLSVTVNGAAMSGFWVNHMDIAPRYAGTLMGISNGLASMSGFIAPNVAAMLTKDQTRESWQMVFFIAAGVSLFGGVVYNFLGTGVIQPWAVDTDDDDGDADAIKQQHQQHSSDVGLRPIVKHRVNTEKKNIDSKMA